MNNAQSLQITLIAVGAQHAAEGLALKNDLCHRPFQTSYKIPK